MVTFKSIGRRKVADISVNDYLNSTKNIPLFKAQSMGDDGMWYERVTKNEVIHCFLVACL